MDRTRRKSGKAAAAAHPSPAIPLPAELGMLVAQVRRRCFYAIASRVEPLGHSVYAWQLINHMHRLGGATQRELANASAQHPAGVSRLLDELEKTGLVERHRDAHDRRKVVAGLTRRGRATLAAMRPEVHAALADVLAPLSLDEQRALRGLLVRLI